MDLYDRRGFEIMDLYDQETQGMFIYLNRLR